MKFLIIAFQPYYEVLNWINLIAIRHKIELYSDLRQALKGAEVAYHFAGSILLSKHDWTMRKPIHVTGSRNVVTACLYCGVCRRN